MPEFTDKGSLLIRADAGGLLGTGHVMRMIALAQAYQKRGGNVVIATIKCPAGIIERIKCNGITHQTVQASDLGSQEDANATIKLSNEIGAKWIVTDGYHFDYDYQKQIKDSGSMLLCVDDHGYSDRWCCDAILNQNLDAEKWGSYANDIEDGKLLLGSPFCLLRDEFISTTQKPKDWERIERLLVTLGGSDSENATEATLEFLNAACSRNLCIRVLVGADNPNLEKLKAIQSRHDIEIVRNTTDMPAQLAWADGIISAGGSTCWEWLNAGLPGAVVTIADNQVPIVQAIAGTHQAALSLGWFNKLDAAVQGMEFMSWLDDSNAVVKRESALSLVDGRGADRVAALLDGLLDVGIITAPNGWLSDRITAFQKELEAEGHRVRLSTSPDELATGDVLLILSYWGLLNQEALAKHCHNLVVHESALPQGKGWSPMTWQVLEGKSEIPITLFEAVGKVDAGSIYARDLVRLDGHELVGELRGLQAAATFRLCRTFLAGYPALITNREEQSGQESFYTRRRPEDSELDLRKSIIEQFDLLRVVDNESYPAFFDYRDHRYVLKIEKTNGNH